MEDSNILTIKSETGRESKYDIIFTSDNDDYHFVVYTANKKDKNDNTIVYFSKSKIGTKKLEKVTKEEKDKLLNVLEKFNKKGK